MKLLGGELLPFVVQNRIFAMFFVFLSNVNHNGYRIITNIDLHTWQLNGTSYELRNEIRVGVVMFPRHSVFDELMRQI